MLTLLHPTVDDDLLCKLKLVVVLVDNIYTTYEMKKVGCESSAS